MEHVSLPEGWKSWQICRILGEGAYGKVYLAEKKIGADVSESAIKIIRISPDENEELALPFEFGSKESVRKYYEDIALSYIQEIKMMIALKGHPNIVYIEDYALEENPDKPSWTIFIRMEYLTPFPEYAQTHPMTEPDVIRLGTDLCSALNACEKRRILHRDIKPSNIFVSPATGQFKLGDFGIARKLERTGSVYSAKGTCPYMAPEVFHSQPSDHRADLYSLGLVLYHLLNRNREPFVDLNKQIVYIKDRENATARRMSGEPIPPPAKASPALGKVILKACDPDPGKRYLNAESFREALESIQSGTVSQEKKSSRKWLLLIPAAVVFALLVLFLPPNRTKPDKAPRPTRIITEAPSKSPEPVTTMQPEPTDTTESIVTKAPTPTNTSKPAVSLSPSPTLTPEPVITEIDISSFGIVPILEGRQLYYHPQTHSCVRIPIREIRKALEDAGCVFSEEELTVFEANLKKQFFPEGNAKISDGDDFAEGDRITLVYTPDETFTALLNGKGYQLVYKDQVFIVKKTEDGSRLRFEPETETGK